jgi:hypothetical protein
VITPTPDEYLDGAQALQYATALLDAADVLDAASSKPDQNTCYLRNRDAVLSLLTIVCDGNRVRATTLLDQARQQRLPLAAVLQELRLEWEKQAERDRCQVDMDPEPHTPNHEDESTSGTPTIRITRGRPGPWKQVTKTVASKTVVTDAHGAELAAVGVSVNDDGAVVVQVDVFEASQPHTSRRMSLALDGALDGALDDALDGWITVTDLSGDQYRLRLPTADDIAQHCEDSDRCQFDITAYHQH